MQIKSVARGGGNNLQIHWYMTNWCNYRCEYCNPNGNSHAWVDYGTITNTADKLNTIIDNLNSNVSLFLVGGEVTYYDLVDLLTNHITSKKLTSLSLISNLSRDLKYFTDLQDYCKSRNIKLSLRGSVHLTQIKDMNEFIEKLRALSETKLNIVLNKENYERTENFLELMKSEKLINKVDILFDKRAGQRSDDVMRVYNKYVNSEDLSKLNNHIITYENDEVVAMTRAQLAVNSPDFTGYKCKGILRIQTSGVVTTGACGVHSQAIGTLNNLVNMSKEDLNNACIVTCTQTRCPLCTFTKIWKD